MKQITVFLRAVFLFPLNVLMGLASGAISAQGSQFFVGTGTGGPITITAISKAFKGEFTAVNTLTRGDRITLAAIAGMIEANGITATVLAASGTSFVLDIDTRAFTAYTSGGTGTPVTWTQLKELKDFKPSGASVSKQDKTNLDSVAMESSPGLPDNGDMTASVNYVSGDPGLIAAGAAFNARATKQFKLVCPNGDTFSFQGYFLKFPAIPSGAVNGLLLGDMTVQIDGAVTKTP